MVGSGHLDVHRRLCVECIKLSPARLQIGKEHQLDVAHSADDTRIRSALPIKLSKCFTAYASFPDSDQLHTHHGSPRRHWVLLLFSRLCLLARKTTEYHITSPVDMSSIIKLIFIPDFPSIICNIILICNVHLQGTVPEAACVRVQHLPEILTCTRIAGRTL